MAAKLTMSIRDTSWSVPVSTPSAASISHWIKSAYCKSQTDLDYTGFSAWFPSVSFIFFRCSSMTGARYLWQTRCDCRSPQNSWATSLTFSFVVTPALRSEEMREEAEDLTDLRHLSCVLNSGLNKLRIATYLLWGIRLRENRSMNLQRLDNLSVQQAAVPSHTQGVDSSLSSGKPTTIHQYPCCSIVDRCHRRRHT